MTDRPTLAVLTSGGDAPGMNTAIRAIVKLALGRGARVVGVENGYEGLMAGRWRELTREVDGQLVLPEEIDEWASSGGTFLGSARSERFRTPEGRAEAARRLEGVDGLIVIGGNGSLAGAHALATEHGVAVMGIPASIDNDIGCTGMAIGVDTALNTIVEACDRISDTARAHRRAFVVEVMGRDCGYLAMASAVAAGADAVLYREQHRSEDEIVRAVEEALLRAFAPPRNKKRVLVIKAEGIPVPCTKLVRVLGERVRDRLPGVEVRATVLGHVVRGGNPSYQDRMIAGRLAFGAVDGLLGGGGGRDGGVAAGGGRRREDAGRPRAPLPAVGGARGDRLAPRRLEPHHAPADRADRGRGGRSGAVIVGAGCGEPLQPVPCVTAVPCRPRASSRPGSRTTRGLRDRG